MKNKIDNIKIINFKKSNQRVSSTDKTKKYWSKPKKHPSSVTLIKAEEISKKGSIMEEAEEQHGIFIVGREKTSLF